MASPKARIVELLGRDTLRYVLQRLEIEDVDRRSVVAMRAKLRRARKLSVEDMPQCLRKDDLSKACGHLGLPVTGKRDALVERLLAAVDGASKEPEGLTMSQDTQKELEFATGTPKRKQEKLTLARLNRRPEADATLLRIPMVF